MCAILFATVLALTNQYGAVRLDTRGARVLSYVPRGGSEVFATFADGSGGMPICAPYFASLGPQGARRHGSARYQEFRVVSAQRDAAGARVTLAACSDAATRREFPHDYRIVLDYRLDRALTARMTVTNTGRRPMPLTAAFHPYFRVADAPRCRVEGVAAAPVAVVPGPSRTFPFDGSRRAYALVDPVLGRTLAFDSAGDREAAVWTPGDQQTAALKAVTTSKFRPGEWRTFVAVENGLLRRESEIQLAPGASHTLVRTIIN